MHVGCLSSIIPTYINFCWTKVSARQPSSKDPKRAKVIIIYIFIRFLPLKIQPPPHPTPPLPHLFYEALCNPVSKILCRLVFKFRRPMFVIVVFLIYRNILTYQFDFLVKAWLVPSYEYASLSFLEIKFSKESRQNCHILAY